jgi:hypothetical protein
MLKTLAEAKAYQPIIDAAGGCPNGTTFLGKLNVATERLMARGDFVGTVQPLHICVRGGWIVWPRYVGKIREISSCRGPMPNRPFGWDFIEKPTYDSYRGTGRTLTNWGRSATFNEISSGDRLVRAYIDADADIGKTVKIFGIDNYTGQELRTLNTDGSISDGITLTLAKPFASSSVYVRGPIRVIKEPTEGKVWLGEYDPATGLMIDLAYYEPSETNPDYLRTWLVGCTATILSVVALVKLKFVPAVHDTDLVLIENLRALAYMIQSGNEDAAIHLDDANKLEAKAIRELNIDLADETPDAQIPIVMNRFHGTRIGRQHCF